MADTSAVDEDDRSILGRVKEGIARVAEDIHLKSKDTAAGVKERAANMADRAKSGLLPPKGSLLERFTLATGLREPTELERAAEAYAAAVHKVSVAVGVEAPTLRERVEEVRLDLGPGRE